MPAAKRLSLERDGVQRLIERRAPGSFLSRVRSLAGGARRRVFEIRWRDKLGSSHRVVVRLAPDRGGGARANARSEFQTLVALHTLQFPVPQPLFADLDAEYFSHPAIVMEHAGHPLASPWEDEELLIQCAETLAALHRLSVADTGLSHLSTSTLDERRGALEASLTSEHLEVFEGDALVRGVVDALNIEAKKQEPTAPRLIHEDYWPGNILWRRGRISAVIDWTEATLGDPARDVAQFQIDMALMSGFEPAKRFGEFYKAAAGQYPRNLRYVQLFGIRPALAHLQDWFLPGYLDLGLYLTLPILEERLRDYIRWVLE
jgi:aminoglycoside phosphotransferase (APT) family kinase protein